MDSPTLVEVVALIEELRELIECLSERVGQLEEAEAARGAEQRWVEFRARRLRRV